MSKKIFEFNFVKFVKWKVSHLVEGVHRRREDDLLLDLLTLQGKKIGKKINLSRLFFWENERLFNLGKSLQSRESLSHPWRMRLIFFAQRKKETSAANQKCGIRHMYETQIFKNMFYVETQRNYFGDSSICQTVEHFEAKIRREILSSTVWWISSPDVFFLHNSTTMTWPPPPFKETKILTHFRRRKRRRQVLKRQKREKDSRGNFFSF